MDGAAKSTKPPVLHCCSAKRNDVNVLPVPQAIMARQRSPFSKAAVILSTASR